MAASAAAQAYPSGPIRFIVGYTAGASAADILARAAAQAMSASKNVPVIVDNRPGAGGPTGATPAACAQPHGPPLRAGYHPTHGRPQRFTKDLQYSPQW